MVLRVIGHFRPSKGAPSNRSLCFSLILLETEMTKKPNKTAGLLIVAAAVGTLCAPVVSPAAGVYAYPTAGQSEKQQQKDQSECSQWAKKETGFDPSQPAPAPRRSHSSPPPSGSSGVFGRGSYGQGGGIADAGKGAAGGALIGAIAGNAGTGAAIGALSGLFIGGVKRSNEQAEREAWERQQADQHRRQQEAAASQHAAGQSEYGRAFTNCMRARKYQID